MRDTFAIPGRPDLLLTVMTDRVSTHNVIHKSEVPSKGFTLTLLTVFWLEHLELFEQMKTHLVAYGEDIFLYLPPQDYEEDLKFRALVIRKLTMVPVEFIFRSRMAGSLWKDYYQKGLPNPYGLNLPPGLQLMSPFEETIFTPTEKSERDDPINAEATAQKYPEACQLARKAYEFGREFAKTQGIEIIDGKFEVGIDSEGQVVLADECLTPDSCRFVSADGIVIGQEPTWLDKQYLREEAERLWADGKKVPVTFSHDAILETVLRYEQITSALTAGIGL